MKKQPYKNDFEIEEEEEEMEEDEEEDMEQDDDEDMEENEQDSDDEDEEEDEKGQNTNQPKRSKSAPPEMSSKKPVSRFRVVVPTKPNQFKARDPRFHDVHNSGFNTGMFNQDYGFLPELRKQEISALKEQLRKTKNTQQADAIQKQLNRVLLMQKKFDEEQADKRRKEEWKKQQVERIEHGQKPFFLKKSKQREVKMIEKYQELKKKGQLHNFMKKKAAKRAHKDQKLVPFQRRAQ